MSELYLVEGTDPEVDLDPIVVTNPEAAAQVLMPFMNDDVENCYMLALNTRHHLIDVVHISKGSIDHTFMSPREIFRAALLHNASAIIVGHNHPSGDPEPSRDDFNVTRRLNHAGDIVGIDMLDHLVFGSNVDAFVSISRRGLESG